MSTRPPGGAIVCSEPGCERPALHSTVFCRFHLAESMRREGKAVLFTDPELSGIYATVVHIMRPILDGLPPDLFEPQVPSSEIDIYALLHPDAGWQLAQFSLDVLGSFLAGELGRMTLWPPTEVESTIVLRLRVAVPAPAADTFIPLLRSAMEVLLREVAGPGASASLSVTLAEDPDGSWSEVPG